MKQDIAYYLEDCSTQKSFQWSIRCELCGGIWKSKKISFSLAGTKPLTEGKRVIYQTLYEREKEQAMEHAMKEARESFSLCPVCHRIVCDHCFLMCEEIEICSECAENLQETGMPVALA